ncbi:MAG: hypothetical protein K2Q26_05610 [Bdellovibrionales bacterium]|nr:hypothetical protein [Bdellovibrionales bacterium]
MKKYIFIVALVFVSCTSTAPKEGASEDETSFTKPPSSEEVMLDRSFDTTKKIDVNILKSLKNSTMTADVFVSLKMTWAEVDDCRDAISKTGIQLYPGPALVPDSMFSARGNLASLRKLARLKCVKKIELDRKSQQLNPAQDD